MNAQRLGEGRPSLWLRNIQDAQRHTTAWQARDATEIASVLADPSRPSQLRYWAALALAQLEAREQLPVILRAMDDDVELVQQGAMLALQHFPAEPAVPMLCRKSSSHVNPQMRYLATIILFSVNTERATICIVQTATNANEDFQARWQALYHLWDKREPSDAFDELLPALSDEHPTLRALAAMALSKRYESDLRVMDSLGVRRSLGTALLEHEADMFTYRQAIERFEQLTGAVVMLDPWQDTEYYNFEKKGPAIVDQRIQAWLDSIE